MISPVILAWLCVIPALYLFTPDPIWWPYWVVWGMAFVVIFDNYLTRLWIRFLTKDKPPIDD